MSRRHHYRQIDGRKMDYADPADMHAAALIQRQRRGDATTSPYVIGRLVLTDADTVTLEALDTTPGVLHLPPGTLSTRQRTWYRWRTKQAARQWLQRNPHPLPLRVINLDSMQCALATGA